MQKLIKTNGKFIEIDCFKIKMVILMDGLHKGVYKNVPRTVSFAKFLSL